MVVGGVGSAITLYMFFVLVVGGGGLLLTLLVVCGSVLRVYECG